MTLFELNYNFREYGITEFPSNVRQCRPMC